MDHSKSAKDGEKLMSYVSDESIRKFSSNNKPINENNVVSKELTKFYDNPESNLEGRVQ
ncbi:hypothetical protein MKZ07_30390 [Paenibacillus sp. FSL P4-0338]|uniref:hypothetical protein n=1 Tax=Paenibacillus sp. FSL P4-0338 TaxID=2921635 RepID=UPI0030F6075F